MSEHEKKHIKLMVTIVARGMGDKIVEALRAHGIRFNLVQLGRGTADSELLNLLGLGSSEKDIVLSVVRDYRVAEAMEILKQDFDFNSPGTGVAFTIPIASVGGLKTLQIISGLHEKRSESHEQP